MFTVAACPKDIWLSLPRLNFLAYLALPFRGPALANRLAASLDCEHSCSEFLGEQNKGMENGGRLNVCKVRCKFPRMSQMTQRRGGTTGCSTKASLRFTHPRFDVASEPSPILPIPLFPFLYFRLVVRPVMYCFSTPFSCLSAPPFPVSLLPSPHF